jgi:hypothetical protein
MASSALPSRTLHRRALPSSTPCHPATETFAPGAVSRRRAAVRLLSAGFLTAVAPPPSLAARRGRVVVPPEDYATARTSACLLPGALVFFPFFWSKVGTFLCERLTEFQLITTFLLVKTRILFFYCKCCCF